MGSHSSKYLKTKDIDHYGPEEQLIVYKDILQSLQIQDNFDKDHTQGDSEFIITKKLKH
ncbi:hypothetical protein DFA_11740 [Cavenderia fasciculata]|uniref:Uncharacterized protein n=1 Tax=Cavenderia fasciculata TaxID=261658 RepID=F4QE32_CACFS|nr:uncharacterized protein DFA_11740 [Cavenderia fasciculata]EGG13979.1 hypothetical protein DFA_11740 [Cavenderia fasciculata]|eukprot:XP_004350687.1 hypothetical protein DFA_11740 [Cavenderia fasciculata]